MAIALVQAKSAATVTSGSVNSLTATFDAGATVNNLLTAQIFTRGDALTNPAGWSTAVNVDNTTENDETRIAYKVATGGETAVVFTWAANDDAGLHIREYSGMATSTPVDVVASTGRTTDVTSLSSGTTATTAQADELLLSAHCLRDAVTSPSLNNSFTLDAHVVGGSTIFATLLAGSRIVAATSTYETTASWTTSVTAMGAIATFKAAAGGASLVIPNRNAMRALLAR